MAAPVGNQFWKLRSKHGRDRLFSTPELMMEAATEYFQWCLDNPYYINEQRKGAVIVPKNFEGDLSDLVDPIIKIPQARPFTMQGLCRYLCCNTVYFAQFINRLKPDESQTDKDFANIITCIKEIVYEQKFDGAAAGFFNANIIARDLGLRDKTELSTPPDGEGKFEVTLNIT